MNILKQLYYGNIAEIHRKLPNKNKDLELKLYEELKDKLKEEQLKLFIKYIDIYGKRMDKALEDKYIQGFKTGLLIGMETKKLNLDI